MANEFSKEERVAFDELLMGFQDLLTLSPHVKVYNRDQVQMERSGDTIHRPIPYIAVDQDGTPGVTVTYDSNTQLTVPVSINKSRAVTFSLDAKELRDMLQEQRFGDAAKQKLSSVINQNITDVVSDLGSLVIARTGAPSGYDDVAEVEAVCMEQGVPEYDMCLALNPRDYNAMSGDLANRAHIGAQITTDAYRKAYVGQVASFETLKLNYSKRLVAAAGSGITIATTAGAADYTPISTDVNGNNVDNRFQSVTVSATTNVKAGDCFTIANCQSVNQITKEPTGQLKTFRVVSVDSGTELTITPPIVAASSSPTKPEEQYKNCDFAATSATAAITFINTQTAQTNLFWQKEAIEIIPGRYGLTENAGSKILRGTTDQGYEMTLMKAFNQHVLKTEYRCDVFFGVANKAPEMSGILLFGQS